MENTHGLNLFLDGPSIQLIPAILRVTSWIVWVIATKNYLHFWDATQGLCLLPIIAFIENTYQAKNLTVETQIYSDIQCTDITGNFRNDLQPQSCISQGVVSLLVPEYSKRTPELYCLITMPSGMGITTLYIPFLAEPFTHRVVAWTDVVLRGCVDLRSLISPSPEEARHVSLINACSFKQPTPLPPRSNQSR